MTYDGSNPLHVAQARARIDRFANAGKIFELTEKRPRRSLPQNAYLHVLLAYFASQYGERMEYVKDCIYKAHVNRDLFLREKEDRLLGKIPYLRSTADLDSAEMALSIDRFRTWAAQEAGIYLPSADEHRLLAMAEMEIERNKEYV